MNSHSLKVIVLCFILLVGLPLARAQQQTPRDRPDRDGQDQRPNAPRPGGSDQGQMVLREYTSLVNLTVTVTDKHNRLVTGLEREHFEIFEDNIKQTIEFFTNEDAPLSVGIIFDVSESMQDKLSRAREALGAFVRTCHNNDDFFLVTFNHRPTLTGDFSNGNTVMRNLASV